MQESARGAVEIAHKIFPEVEGKWGETGLDEIIQDDSIVAVAVVLTGQTQVSLSLSQLIFELRVVISFVIEIHM